MKRKKMLKNKIKIKFIKKTLKTAIFVVMAMSLLVQSLSVFALEIEAVNTSVIANKTEWGKLTDYTDLSEGYSDYVTNRIKAANENPELFLSDKNLSNDEKNDLIDAIKNAPNELVFKSISDIDTSFEKEQLLTSLNNASDNVLESLKKADIIKTYINPESQIEEIINPKLNLDNGGYQTTATPYQIELPVKSNDPTSIKFDSIESVDEQTKTIPYQINYLPVSANLVTAVSEENKLIYTNQWDNVDVAVTAKPEGIKEDIILKSEHTRQITPQNSGYHGDKNWVFYYKLDLTNVYPEIVDNQIVYKNKSGSIVAAAGQPFLIDNRGEISTNAYYDLITAAEFNRGFSPDSSRFNLNINNIPESDLSLPVSEISETDLSLPEDIESIQTDEIDEIHESDLSNTATVQSNEKSLIEILIDSIKYIVNSAFQTFGVTAAQESDLSLPTPIDNLIPEFDQTISPVEQIGLEMDKSSQENIENNYAYLVLSANTVNLEYPIDIDPTTYLFTNTDSYNTANGLLLSNNVTDVKLYDTTSEPTSNYKYNQELKSTLATNNSIGLVNPTDLAGLWNFDENDLSSSAEDDNTTPVNGVLQNDPSYSTGIVNTAITLDGVNQYISMADDNDFSFANHNFAMSVWVKPDNFTNRQPIISKGSASNWEYVLYLSTDAQAVFTARLLNGTEIYTISTPQNSVKLNEWTHIVVSNSEDSQISLYINGQKSAKLDTSAIVNNLSNGTAALEIGRTADGGADYFDGSIDELKIYRNILTDNEITNLFENSKSKLLAWINMQENGTDNSGQINHGTLTGTELNENGKVAASRIFDGTDSINLGNNFSLSPSNYLTVETWVKAESKGTVIAKDNEYKMEICSDGRPMFYIYNHNQWQNTAGTADLCTGSSANIITDQSWHHLAGSFDGRYIRLYIDGIEQAYYYIQGNISRTENNAIIGENFSGELDELALYNRTLSQDELYHHYISNYSGRVTSVAQFDQNISFTEHSQLALDNLIVTVPGILQIKGIDQNGQVISEKIKIHAGTIPRILSANRYHALTEINILNIFGEANGAKLQIASGRLLAFSPYHDANWRYGISKSDDLVTGVWHFDEGSGSVTNDSSGANNHGFLSGGTSGSWLYSREIDLTPATPVSDYQVKLEFNPENIDYQNIQSDGDDLRFFDSNNNELAYWIENWNTSGKSIVWVKVPSAGTSIITMKYGNSSVYGTSDGNAVFELFDDFNDGIISTSKWSGTTGFTESNGYLNGGNTTNRILSVNSFTGNFATKTRHLTTTEATNGHMALGFWASTTNAYGIQYQPTNNWYRYNDTAFVGPETTPYINEWVKPEVIVNGTTASSWWNRESDDVNTTRYNDTNSGLSTEKIALGEKYNNTNTGQTYTAKWDWIFVRKYSSSEPIAKIGGLKLTSEQYVSQPVWYNTSWNYRAPIYIDNSQNPSALTNYQVPIAIDTTELVPANMQADFDDVRFTETDQTTPIDYFYDSVNSSANSTKFWVEIPTIAAKSTKTIYIYYGNSGASAADNFDNVFVKNYITDNTSLRARWHVDDASPSATVADSSGNANTGTRQNSPAWAGIDGGQFDSDSTTLFSTGDHLTFNGTNQYVSIATQLSFADTANFTVELWYKGTDTAANGDYGKTLLGRDNADIYANLVLRNGYAEYIHYNTTWQHNLKSSTMVADGNWHHIAFTQDSSQTGYLYIDGRLEATGSSSISNDANPYRVNNFMRGYNAQYTSGAIDEIRFYDKKLSGDIIKTHYERRQYTPEIPTASISATSPDSSIPNWSTNGKFGSALSFDGKNDYVVIPDEDSLDAKKQLTVGAWINPGAMDGWLYNKSLTIDPPTNVDNLQLNLTLNTANFNYLNSNPDGSDLRFADNSGNLLPYYIESWDPLGTSEIWFKASKSGTSKVYMYYGNQNAVSESNFDNTFSKNAAKSGLAGLWYMDEGSGGTTADYSGNSNTGTLSSGATWQSTDGGQWGANTAVNYSTGKHLAFDGTANAKVALGNNASLQLSTFTFESWVKRSVTGTNDMLYAWGLGGPAVYIKSTNTLAIGKIGTWEQVSTGTIADTNWHHLAVTYEEPIISYYIDGVLDSTDVQTSPGFTFGTSASLGIRPDTNADPLNGFMDEARLYNRILSASEISAHYERRNFGTNESRVSTSSQQVGSPASIYQRIITLNPSTPYLNYTAEIDLTPANFDYSRTRADGGDLRFYDNSGNALSYYIQNWNPAGKSVVFVNIPIAGTNQVIMQYGEKDVYSLSDGNNTLSLHDDFNDGQFNSSIWSKVRVQNNSWNEGADLPGWFKLKALNGVNMEGDTASAPMILSHQDFGDHDYEIYTTIQFDPNLPSQNTQTGGIIVYQDDDNYLTANLSYRDGEKSGIKLELNNSSQSFEQDFSIPSTVDLKLVKTGNNYTYYYKNHTSSSWIQHPSTISANLSMQKIGFISFSDTGSDLPIYYDNFQVIKKSSSNSVATISAEENWTYKRSISLNPATIEDDVQIQLLLDGSFPYGNLQSAGQDLRFYDSNFNKLNYWIEYWNNAGYSNYSSIWVDIPNSATEKIYMYYGNANVSSESNGNNTFPFFDDFSGTTINSTRWVEFDNGNYLSQNDKIIASGGSGAWGSNGLTSTATFNRADRYELRYDYKPTSGSGSMMMGWHDSGVGTSYTDLIYAYYDLNPATVDVYEDGNNRTPQIAGVWTNGTNYKVSLRLKSDTGAIIRKSANGGVSWENSYNSTYSSETPLKIGFSNNNKPFEIDNMFLIKKMDIPSVPTLDEVSSWFYQKTINLEKNGSATTTPSDNYQIKIDFTPSDIEYNNVNEDGSDIRFFDNSGKQLNYWIERWAPGGTSTVWVNIPDSGTASITMFYGNQSANSFSNGSATFDFFDDFEDRSLDTNKWSWTREVSGEWDEGISQSGMLMITALNNSNMWESDNSAPILTSINDFSADDYEVSVRMQISPSDDYQQGGLIVYDDDSNHIQGNKGYNSGQKVTFKKETAGTASATDANQSDTDLDLRLRKVDNTFRFFYKKHNLTTWTEFGSGSELDLTMANQYLGLASYSDIGADVPTYFDDFRVNKISEINPANDIVGVISSEQAKDADVDQTKNIFQKGSSYSFGATDSDIYGNLGTQTISAPLSDGWTHVVQVYDGNQQKLFINGDLKASIPYSTDLVVNTDDILLGNKFFGMIDDVVISQKAFSNSQIKDWYQTGDAYLKTQPVEAQTESVNNADILTDNLAGYWKLDDASGLSAADSSTNNNPGTLTNGPVWITGKSNSALNFDDVDDYVSVGNVTPLSFEYNQPFSISAWIKTSNTTTDDIIASKMENSGNFRGYSFGLTNSTNGRLNMVIRNTTTNYLSVNGSTKVNDNQWHHVTATYDGSNLAAGVKMYVDGNLETNTNLNDALGTNTIINTQSFNIGSRASGGVPFKGAIDDVRVYNDILSNSEAMTLANMYNYRFGNSENLSTASTINITGTQSNPDDRLAIKFNTAGPVGIASYNTSRDNGLSWSQATYVSSIESSNLIVDGVDTGIDISFEFGANYSIGNVFNIASWYTEPRSATRGIRRSFPEIASIVATNNTVNQYGKSIEIIDTSDNSLWMRFTNSNDDDLLGGPATVIKGLDMVYGQLFAGSQDASADSIGLLKVDFTNDTSRYFRNVAEPEIVSDNLSNRNGGNTFLDDNSITLNDTQINDVDAEMLNGKIIVTVGASGSNGGVNIIDEANQSIIYGTSGGDDINKLKLATNGNLYLSNNSDANILAIDQIINYHQNFNFANRNETYSGNTPATYFISSNSYGDIVVNESASIADNYGSDKIVIGGNQGVGVVDTMTSKLSDDVIGNDLSGFTQIINSQYITEHMNGVGAVKGMWIAGDQTPAASVQDRSIEGNNMLVNGFSSGTITNSDLGSGVRGSSIIFTGNDYLSLTDNSDFDFSDSDNLSFGAWVNPATSQTQVIFAQNNNFKLSTANSSGQIVYEAAVNKNSANYSVQSAEYDLSDTWHYVVGVHDGLNDVLKLYVDGKLENDITTPAAYNINNSASNITIGANHGGADYFDGRISGVFAAENNINEKQIEKLYQIGLGALNDNSDDLNKLFGSSDAVSAVAIDKNSNKIYVGTTDGLSEINLNTDSRTNYWNTGTTPALPANSVISLDYASNRALVATNSGALVIKTDGSYTNSSSLGQVLSGAGRDVFTDGAYNYFVNQNGLDVISLTQQSRLGYVLRDGGFTSVTAFGGRAFMGTADNGIYSVNISTMSGETTVNNPTYHTNSSLSLMSNNIFDLHGRQINGKNYLAVATDSGAALLGDLNGTPYGIYFYTNEGDDITKIWLNEVGDLAYYNATTATINIYNNAIGDNIYPFQTGTNSYHRQYSVSSTPNYIGSTVNDLVYVAHTSTALANADTLYVATNNGASVIQEHTTQASGTVKHYVNRLLHDERTGVFLPFTNNLVPVNKDDVTVSNTVNQYDPTRTKYNYSNDNDLAGFWDFDQSLPAQIADRSGRGNHGGFGPNTGVSGGIVGQSLYLDGHQSYMIVNDAKSLHPTSAFSISGWVWKDAAISNDASGEPIIASKYDTGTKGEFVLYYNKNNKLQLKVADGATSALSGESSVISPQTWHHVAVTFDLGKVRFYIDGQLDSTHTVAVTNLALPPYASPADMTDLYIGNDWSLNNNAYGGYIDELAYYTRAIDPAEISLHASLPSINNSVTVANHDSLSYRTSANLTTNSGAGETMYLNFDETISGSQGENYNLAIESELQRPDLDLISYGGNTNNNIVLDLGTSGAWDDNDVHSPNILKDGNIYKMWYTGGAGAGDYRIGYATSMDGINWVKYAGNLCTGTGATGNGCVFERSGAGFDSTYVYYPTVIKENNTFKMWYGGSNGSSLAIGYATSSDGINWTRANSGNAVLTSGSAGSWDDAGVFYPEVIKEGSVYKMWYSGQQSGANFRLGYAVSTDGISWSKYDDTATAACGFSESNDNGCLVTIGATGSFYQNDIEQPRMKKIDQLYYLYFTGHDGTDISRTGVMTSRNGFDWTIANESATILGLNTSGLWDDAQIYTPSQLSEGNDLFYYSAQDGTNSRIGLATRDFEAGRYGKSLRIENNDIYKYDVTNDINHSQGTISFWAKLDNTTNEHHEVFNLQSKDSISQDGLFVALKSGQIIAGYNGLPVLSTPQTLTNNYWNHFALSWSKPSLSNYNFQLYMNGQLVESTTYDQIISANYDTLQLGGNAGETRDYLDGNLDEFRIYNQSLTASDIKELYNGSIDNSAKINTVSKLAEGSIEFDYTPDWDSTTDNEVRTLLDLASGDPARIGVQYKQSKSDFNRLRVWKEEGPTVGDNDRLHFSIIDSDGDLYETYTNEDINWSNSNTYHIAINWDLDNNDAAALGNNILRILVDNTLIAGDNFTSGITDNKKKNGSDTNQSEAITISNLSENFWIGSGTPLNLINNLINSSFETAGTSDPENWNKTGSISFDQSGANSKYGNNAVSVTGPRATNRLQQTIYGVIPGNYTLSWWAKGSASDSTQDIDVQHSAGPTQLSGTTGNNTDPGTNYKFYSINFTVLTTGNLTLTLSANSAETVWFDALTLTKGRLPENFVTTSSSYSNFKTGNYLPTQAELTAEYLALKYDTTNDNASLAGETNNSTAIAVKKITTNANASDEIMFVGTKGQTNQGAVTQISFGTPDLRTNEYRQDTSGNSITSNRINSLSYSSIRNNLAIATEDAGVFGFYDDIFSQITLISPNTATEWEGGSSQTITWNTDVGECDHIGLSYTTNGGSSFSDIVTSTPDDGSYTWNPIDEINSNQITVKVACLDPFGAELSTDNSDNNIVIDSTSPVFSIYNIPNPSGDNVIYVRGRGTDTGGATSIAEVQYKVDANDWSVANINSGAGTTNIEYGFSTTALSAGPHTIYVKGKDSSLPNGNELDMSQAATRTFNIDALSISFSQLSFPLNLSMAGDLSQVASVDVSVNGYGTDYSLGIKANQPPTNRYYPSVNIPFYTGNDNWSSNTVGFGWKTNGYNSGFYNDFQTSAYEIFKNSFASLLGDKTTIDFKTTIDWTVAAGDYDTTVSIVAIPRY